MRHSKYRLSILGITSLALLALVAALHADEISVDEKPFAEAHIVLQLGDDDPKIQARVISVANNLIKHYGGPEFVNLEIVTYGPGISLLYPSSPSADRVKSLLASEVRLVGCMNTVETITRQTGIKPELIEGFVPVKTGVAHLVERVEQGYVVIRP